MQNDQSVGAKELLKLESHFFGGGFFVIFKIAVVIYVNQTTNNMKSLLDDTLVPARAYYYLLDFNDRTKRKFILEIAPESQGRLCLLEKDEFWALFKFATEFEIKNDWSEFE